MAAIHLAKQTSAFGGCYRRLGMRAGTGKAIVALAAELARTVYAMVENGTVYEDGGDAAYKLRYRERVVKNLQRRPTPRIDLWRGDGGGPTATVARALRATE